MRLVGETHGPSNHIRENKDIRLKEEEEKEDEEEKKKAEKLYITILMAFRGGEVERGGAWNITNRTSSHLQGQHSIIATSLKTSTPRLRQFALCLACKHRDLHASVSL